MALEGVFSVLTNTLVVSALILLGIQLTSMIWSKSIAKSLSGQEGGELAYMLYIMAVAIFIAQGLSVARAILLDLAPISSIDARVALFLIEETELVTASVYVMARARHLRNQPPVDGPGEAVIELDAQPTAEVPLATGDVGPAVDHGHGDGLPVPPELD